MIFIRLDNGYINDIQQFNEWLSVIFNSLAMVISVLFNSLSVVISVSDIQQLIDGYLSDIQH
jgi:hypothetical protein